LRCDQQDRKGPQVNEIISVDATTASTERLDVATGNTGNP